MNKEENKAVLIIFGKSDHSNYKQRAKSIGLKLLPHIRHLLAEDFNKSKQTS